MTLCSMGPRQIMGLSPGLSRPMEITFRPATSTGMMCLSMVASGSCVVPSMMGTLGPYTSASRRPTLWPSFTRASARLTATVVLPTPPLPLAMATRFFTPGMGWRSGICCGAAGGIWAFSLVGQASCPSSTVKSTTRATNELLRLYGSCQDAAERPQGCVDSALRYSLDGNFLYGISHAVAPWHFLYFLPEPHGHGSLRPTFAPARTGFGASACAGPV